MVRARTGHRAGGRPRAGRGTDQVRPADSRIFPWAPRCRTQATGGDSMRRIFGIAGIAAVSVFAAACNSTNTSSSTPSAGKSAYTFYMDTHGDNGTFWSVLLECEKQAAAGGLPLILINICGVTSSGQSYIAYSGAITCVGQPESAAGLQAGLRLKADGGKHLLCVIHEATSTSLRDRCSGAKSGFGGSETDLVLDNAKSNVSGSTATLQAKLSADTTIDSILALDPDVAKNIVEAAAAGASSKAKIATFDLSAGVVADIQSGKIDFAVDQQQYLQGYLSIIFLKLFKSNANTVGGFDTVKSGPGIVDKTNAAQDASLAGQGTR